MEFENNPPPGRRRGDWRRWLQSWGLPVSGIVFAAALLILFRCRPDVFVSQQPASLERQPLQTVVLDDGSELSLEAVTVGTNHECVERLVPRKAGLLPVSIKPLVEKHHTTKPSAVVWLSRRDPKTGRFLGFDRWDRSTVVDRNGCKLFDGFATYSAYGPNAVRSMSLRPTALPVSVTDRWAIARTEFPMFFPGKRLKFELLDRFGTILARFDVPSPIESPAIDWSPQPLPIERSDGDLDVRLTLAQARELRHDRPRRDVQGHEPGLGTNFQWDLLQNGMSAQGWSISSVALSDHAGNVVARSENDGIRTPFTRFSLESGRMEETCTEALLTSRALCPHEPALKLALEFHRNLNATFAPDEIWKVGGVRVPSQRSSLGLNAPRSMALGETQLELLATGSDTRCFLRNVVEQPIKPGFLHAGRNSLQLLSARIEPFGARGIEIRSSHPFILLRVRNLGDRQLRLFADGREGPVSTAEGTQGDLHFYFLQTGTEWADVTFTVEKQRRFEFIIATPPLEVSPRTPAGRG